MIRLAKDGGISKGAFYAVLVIAIVILLILLATK